MTMSGHKLTAGDGYMYLIRQVAAVDGTDKGRSSLADYYSSKGESPGRWIGSGLAGLGEPIGRDWSDPMIAETWSVERGSEVTESQMKALFGEGKHPNADKIMKYVAGKGVRAGGQIAAARLGSPFKIYEDKNPFRSALAVAYADYNRTIGACAWAAIEDDVRSRIRTSVARGMFWNEHQREPSDDSELSGWIAKNNRPATKAVAGYDLTFSPVKSISALWAIAPRDVAATIEECHNAAIADVIAYLEQEVIFTRLGTNGIAQIDTDGIIATAFTHRDSRAGDPDLHTHVAISNKVRAIGADGVPRWLAIDGRPLFKAMVASSELYNTRMEAHFVQKIGGKFAERPTTDFRKRPIRELVGLNFDLITRWSSRRAAIEHRIAELSKAFQVEHHREPTTVEAVVIAQQATLDTRTAKKEPRSLSEQRHMWRTQAIETLGGERELSDMIADVLGQTQEPVELINDEWLTEKAAKVISTVSQSRSQWQKTHVLAEARRLVRNEGQYSDPLLAEKLTDRALSVGHSIEIARVGDAEMNEPAVLRRRDGTSVYKTHNTQLYTSEEIRSAERRIVAAASREDGRSIDPQLVDIALLEQAANSHELNAGQAMMVREMATSGRRVQLVLAPAGSGKTTAMATLASAWQDSGGSVLGLAPTAAAAEVLRQDLGALTDTVAKLVFMATGPADIAADDVAALEWFKAIDEKTLIIVDEAGLAGTLDLDVVVAIAMARGASVRFVGDDQQLASIAAGGVLRDIDATAGALTLSQIMRFKNPAEGAASLAIRAGDVAGIGFYLDEHRVHVSSESTSSDNAYTQWKADKDAGLDALLLAPTNEIVTDLNARARLDRLRETGPTSGREVVLADGLSASAGDIICSRENARWLKLTGTDFVRNGYRWEIIEVTDKGHLKVRHLQQGYTRLIPAKYVRKSVTLGYASTIDSAEGLTCQTVHTVGSDRLNRQQLYVAMTRGKIGNHFYVSTAEADPHRILTPKAIHPETVVDVLSGILARDGAQESVLSAERRAADPFARLASAADMYADALGSGAEAHLGPDVLAALDRDVNTVVPALTDCAAWPVLRKHLAQLAMCGTDPIAALQEAADKAELASAHDRAAVLQWRLGPTRTRTVAPLPWLTAIPDALLDDPTWNTYLQDRAALVSDLASQVHAAARTWTLADAPAWARPLVGAGKHALVAMVAVYRAATGVDVNDTRLTGAPQYPNSLRAAQQHLNTQIENALGAAGAEQSRWNPLVDELDTHIRQDPYWPHLAEHLNVAARAGVNVRELVGAAVADHGPLPTELPAAALWWRLSGSLSPATLDVADTRLRPSWVGELHHVLGSDLAEAVVADPAWPGLVAAIEASDPQWSPHDLLTLAYEHLRDLDHDYGHHLRPDEYARLLTYRIDLQAAAHTLLDIPDPEHPPLSEEEAEELGHFYPDPEAEPVQLVPYEPVFEMDEPPLSEEEAEELGYLYPDEDTQDAWLYFEDDFRADQLAPIDHTPADLLALQEQLAAAKQHVAELTAQMFSEATHGGGPAMRAAKPELIDMTTRYNEQRPYAFTLSHAHHDWVAADLEAEAHHHQLVEVARLHEIAEQEGHEAQVAELFGQLSILQLQTEHVERAAEIAKAAVASAHRALIDFAGGPDNVVSERAIQTRRARAEQEDIASLNAARGAQRSLENQLFRAEQNAAKSMAQTLTAQSEHTPVAQEASLPAASLVQAPESAQPQQETTEVSYPRTEAELRTYLQAKPLRIRATDYLEALVANESTPAAMATNAREELDRRHQLDSETLAREDTLRTQNQRKRRRTVDERGQTGPDLNK